MFVICYCSFWIVLKNYFNFEKCCFVWVMIIIIVNNIFKVIFRFGNKLRILYIMYIMICNNGVVYIK